MPRFIALFQQLLIYSHQTIAKITPVEKFILACCLVSEAVIIPFLPMHTLSIVSVFSLLYVLYILITLLPIMPLVFRTEKISS